MQFGDDFILFASVFTFAAIYSMMMSNYRTWHLYIIWWRCEENKPLQVHTKKSSVIEMMTGYGAWCHTNVCGAR